MGQCTVSINFSMNVLCWDECLRTLTVLSADRPPHNSSIVRFIGASADLSDCNYVELCST
jgi:hypothetical protein